MIDGSWLNALKLPTQIMVGLFCFFCLLLTADTYKVVELAKFGEIVRPGAIVFALMFGCLSVASIIDILLKPKLLAHRRKVRRDEINHLRVEHEAAAIGRIEFLSKEEIRHAAKCLRENTPSIYGYAHSGPISNLMAKGLIGTPGGQHHQDHYPYYFFDFAWQVLLERKEDIIAKDDEFQRLDAEANRVSPRRGRG